MESELEEAQQRTANAWQGLLSRMRQPDCFYGEIQLRHAEIKKLLATSEALKRRIHKARGHG
jgi:hypothetical protein